MPRGVYSRPTTEQRFFKKVRKTSTCWVWLSFTDKDGYGTFNEFRKNIRAHRYSYQLHKGTIPDGLIVRHTCNNPTCVNPSHLILGTHKDNVMDAVISGRNVVGETHGMSIITTDIAKKCKELLSIGMACTKIAKELGVSRHIVYDIKRGRTWKQV